MASEDINNVIDKLAQTSVISELSFAGRGLKLDKEEDAKEIVEAIRDCKSLQSLQLQGNTLGIEASKYIATALEKHPEFERALWSDMFTGRLKTEIPDALRYLGIGIMKAGAKLVVLDLSDNALGPNGMNGLTDFLVSSSCYSLKELKLHNNGLGVTGGKMLANCLNKCYESSVKAGTPLALRIFVSGRGRLETEGSKALATAFKAMASLEEVEMPQNGITHEGITALADAFTVCKNLRHLNLQDNTFTEVGAKSMAKALPHMTKLEVVNFGDCLIRSRGAVTLAKAFKKHKCLKNVNLGFNEIKQKGAVKIAQVMANKESLLTLDLNGNELGESTIDEIRRSLGSKDDALASFSDDEGTADEDDDVEEEEESEEDDLDLQIQGDAIPTNGQKQTVTALEFLSSPSPTSFEGLGSDKVSAVLDHLGDDINDIDIALSTFMKLSTVVNQDGQRYKEQSCQCTDAILSGVLQSEDENITTTFTNALLVHLGLLKGEDKSMKPPPNINGALLLLEHAVQQNYFPKGTKEILKCFLGKPHPLIQSSSKYHHTLLQTLYKF